MDYRIAFSVAALLLASANSIGQDRVHSSTENISSGAAGFSTQYAQSQTRPSGPGYLSTALHESQPIVYASQVDSAPVGIDYTKGSGIQVHQLSDRTVRSLALLGKVWGFLKYHHPDATSGLRNWDAELLNILPSVLSSPSLEATQLILSRWIASLSSISPCTACVSLDQSNLQSKLQSGPLLDWLDDSHLLGKQLRDQLQAVYVNRIGGQQYYVNLQPGVGNPAFNSEDRYVNVRYPDSGFQILAVLRFWNIVEYWYPYRYLLGASWDQALVQALKQVAPAQDSDSLSALTHRTNRARTRWACQSLELAESSATRR